MDGVKQAPQMQGEQRHFDEHTFLEGNERHHALTQVMIQERRDATERNCLWDTGQSGSIDTSVCKLRE